MAEPPKRQGMVLDKLTNCMCILSEGLISRVVLPILAYEPTAFKKQGTAFLGVASDRDERSIEVWNKEHVFSMLRYEVADKQQAALFTW
jgi:hypothetical protein